MTDEVAVTGTPDNDAGNANVDDKAVKPPEGATAEKPAEAAKEETKAPKVEEPKVPEAYEFKMPEGVELDKSAADEFSVIAKELKFPQETVDKLVPIVAAMRQRETDMHAAVVATWVEQVKTDKEFGGDKFNENMAVAKSAMDKFGTPDLKDVLNATGFGNHPEIIRAFYKVGKAISQDGFVTGTAKTGETDTAKRMFPTMN